MALQIIIGLVIGVIFGILQIILLSKVVRMLTSETGGNSIYVILLIVQVFVFVGLLVLIGLYSIISTLVAGVAMALTAIIVWFIKYKK